MLFLNSKTMTQTFEARTFCLSLCNGENRHE